MQIITYAPVVFYRIWEFNAEIRVYHMKEKAKMIFDAATNFSQSAKDVIILRCMLLWATWQVNSLRLKLSLKLPSNQH